MKVIIAGSRGIEDYSVVCKAVEQSGFEITKVISGGARGVDRLGEEWARNHSIPVVIVVPDWQRFGKRAGIMRNQEMARIADGLVAIWDGKSPGTRNMIWEAKQNGLYTYVAPHLL